MEDKEDLSPLSLAEIIQICQNALSMENSLTEGYRSLFLTIEAIALAGAAILVQLEATPYSIFLLAVLGLILCVIWVWKVEERTKIIDEWRQRIFEQTQKEKTLAEYFKWYMPRGLHWKSVRIWLDTGAPLFVIALWAGLVLRSLGLL
jgi:hypothetical protein